MAQCPTCGQNSATVVRCNKCGDTRCYSTVSGKGCASLGHAGTHNQPCKVCKKGKYERTWIHKNISQWCD